MNSYTPVGDWPGAGGHEPSEPSTFTVQGILSMLGRRWPIICGGAFLGILAGVALFSLQTPRYLSTAAILIDPKTPGAIGPGTDFGLAVAVDAAKIGSVAAFIQSDSLLERVVKSEKLYDDPEFGFVPPGFVTRIVQCARTISSPDREDPIDTAIERLRKATSVAREGVSYVIDVTVSSRAIQPKRRIWRKRSARPI